MSTEREMTYSQALGEAERIVQEIESQQIDIDSLTEKVKRASELILFCRTRLRSTEEEIKILIEDKGINNMDADT